MKLQWGLALFTLMEALKQDYMGTLEKVAAMGVTRIEYVGTPVDDEGQPVATPEAIGEKVRALGLVPISSHVMLDLAAPMEEVIAKQKLMGTQAIVMPLHAMESLEEIKALADYCNRFAALCKANGMDFYYHNHYHEFACVDGKPALEWLLEWTDPELVWVELDTYWTVRAGFDPVEIMEKWGARVRRLHQKDLNAQCQKPNVLEGIDGLIKKEDLFRLFGERTQPEDIVPVGTGCLPIQSYIDCAVRLGFAKEILIELDSAARLGIGDTWQGLTPLEMVEQSISNLKAMLEE